MNKNIEKLKELFCSSIELNNSDFKLCWNLMFDELTNKKDIYQFDTEKINFVLLVENISKQLDINKQEISKVSCLFAGFYSLNRLNIYEKL